MAVNGLTIAGFERGAITDETTLGANASRNTTSPISGSVDVSMTYPSGSTTWATNFSFSVKSPDTSSFRKASIFHRFKFSATPAADAAILTIPGTNKKIWITSSRKLKVDTTELTFVMSTGTVYQLEVIADPDWNGRASGAFVVILSDNSHVQQDTNTQSSTFGSMSGVTFGESTAKAGTGPNLNIQIDDVVILMSSSTVKKAVWINSQTVQAIKVPTANGNYNDFVGVGSTTNKYANEDEDPSNSDTDFNFEGQFGVVKRNTTKTWGLSAGTYTGWMIMQICRYSPGQVLPGDNKILIRENSVDYATHDLVAGVGSYYLGPIGSDTLPDGTTLVGNDTRLSALESGVYSNLTYTIYNTGYSNAQVVPTADGTTYDGVWAQTGGTGGSAYTAIDDGFTTSGTDYISSAVLNDKQGVKLTWTISPLTSIGDVVYQLVAKVGARTNAVTGTSGQFKIGVRIGGVDYLCDSLQGAAPSTTTFQDYSLNLSWSGSKDNPATGQRWTKSDIEGAEWYIQHTFVGSGNLEVANFWLDIRTASSPMITTQFMYTIQGTAFTDNGNVTPKPNSLNIKQAINRSNTF